MHKARLSYTLSKLSNYFAQNSRQKILFAQIFGFCQKGNFRETGPKTENLRIDPKHTCAWSKIRIVCPGFIKEREISQRINPEAFALYILFCFGYLSLFIIVFILSINSFKYVSIISHTIS